MCGGVVLLFLVSSSLTRDVKVARGPYTPTWEGLEAWECPEWFKDAKFGIWAHWGPQCEAESGDWYARHMYYEYHWQNHNHLRKYGNPNDFGLMDLCNEWKGENWDPEELVALYKSVGARYFFTLGQHHDNFDHINLNEPPFGEGIVNIKNGTRLRLVLNEILSKSGQMPARSGICLLA